MFGRYCFQSRQIPIYRNARFLSPIYRGNGIGIPPACSRLVGVPIYRGESGQADLECFINSKVHYNLLVETECEKLGDKLPNLQ